MNFISFSIKNNLKDSKYQYEVELKAINVIKAFTFTNENRMPENEPSLEYKKVIEDGLKETLLLKSE